MRRALVRIYAWVDRHALIRPGDRVLDIGLGGGQLAGTMRERFGAEYAGITIGPAELDRAGQEGVRAELADMHDLCCRTLLERPGGSRGIDIEFQNVYKKYPKHPGFESLRRQSRGDSQLEDTGIRRMVVWRKEQEQ